ncbi:hypothetical protein B0H10DRAFT_2170916 [Mycena sp. CBHHK59/15]|nr:hypothetical protein B0H10DRAFT_2170916 [Mycena sp. CBHHK59/15]
MANPGTSDLHEQNAEQRDWPRVRHSSFTSNTHHSRGRRPPSRNPMHWLSRSSTQSSFGPSKPTRISEPKLIRSIEILSSRAGVLGAGATVVRTPDEALRDTGVRMQYDDAGDDKDGQELEHRSQPSNDSSSEEEDEIPSPPDSPPLPPIPSDTEEKPSFHFDADPQPFSPPRPMRAVPTTPTPALRPSFKTKRTESVDVSSVVPLFPPTSHLHRLLHLSTRFSIIVTLETCAATYRTTLDTLSSRPSFISNYIASLFGRRRSDSVASSVYSTASEDMSAYRRHLTSQGLLPQTSPRYVLPPRAAQAGLDDLLELRAEAAYLGLDGLSKLCTNEIRQRHGPRLHTRSRSSGSSIHSLHASVCSLQTTLERVERQHSRSLSKDSTVDEMGNRSPPTPESWAGRRFSRLPPAGWL